MGTLSLLLVLPLLGAFCIAVIPKKYRFLIRPAAITTATLAMLFSWWLLMGFDTSSAAPQFSELHRWNPRLGAHFALGVDGFSLPMAILATLLCFIAILASHNIKERTKSYYILILILETAMLGVFMARDWSLFYVFWESTLIPLFFLIDRWGGKGHQAASLNFVLYTMGGSVFMLISLLVLFDSTPGHSFAMDDMMAGAQNLPVQTQILIFLGFLIGFGVKMPIFPMHGWLPLAHVEAPSPVSILLSGILLKMGSYGLIRIAGLLPDAIIALQTLLVTLALISIIYGGLLAWKQSDLKAMIAYSSVSHMGVVLLGIATLNTIGLTGAVMQMVAHGLVAGALFLLIGLLYERTGTRDVNRYSSLVRVTPRFAFFTVLAFMATVALPGTAGFIAELHVLIGGYERWGMLVIILSIGVLISAAYSVRTVGRLFTGPVRKEMKEVEDLRPSEMLGASILTGGVILIGLFPAPILAVIHESVAGLSQTLAGHF
jgi:NADH-quinone oxidoreductase subunit M